MISFACLCLSALLIFTLFFSSFRRRRKVNDGWDLLMTRQNTAARCLSIVCTTSFDFSSRLLNLSTVSGYHESRFKKTPTSTLPTLLHFYFVYEQPLVVFAWSVVVGFAFNAIKIYMIEPFFQLSFHPRRNTWCFEIYLNIFLFLSHLSPKTVEEIFQLIYFRTACF